MTREEIYKKIVRIADELSDVHFASRMIYSVKANDRVTFERLIDRLKRYKGKAYNEIIEIGNTINTLVKSDGKRECVIFSDKGNTREGINKFDVNQYDCLTLFIISLLGNFEVVNLFENWGSSDSSFAFAEDVAYYSKYLSNFVFRCKYAKFYKKYSTLYEFIQDILEGQYEKQQ